MRALAHAIGVTVEDEAALELRFDDIAQGVMHHAVAERCRADEAAFRLVNVKIHIGARKIEALRQLLLQQIQVLFQPVLK